MTFEAMAEQVGMDREVTVRRFVGSEAMLMKFLRQFLQDGTFAELERAVKDGESKEILRGAHTLKGVCANLGLQALSDQCSDLVEDVRLGDSSNVAALFQKAEREYLRVTAVIAQLDA